MIKEARTPVINILFGLIESVDSPTKTGVPKYLAKKDNINTIARFIYKNVIIPFLSQNFDYVITVFVLDIIYKYNKAPNGIAITVNPLHGVSLIKFLFFIIMLLET